MSLWRGGPILVSWVIFVECHPLCVIRLIAWELIQWSVCYRWMGRHKRLRSGSRHLQLWHPDRGTIFTGLIKPCQSPRANSTRSLPHLLCGAETSCYDFHMSKATSVTSSAIFSFFQGAFMTYFFLPDQVKARPFSPCWFLLDGSWWGLFYRNIPLLLRCSHWTQSIADVLNGLVALIL